MSSFNAGGIRIAYEDQGDGAPIILVHGFAASFETNWVAPGWVDRFVAEGRRVVGLDCRGHGASEKPYEPSAYAGEVMAQDVIDLVDHLKIERADLMGYSMGGVIATQLLARHGSRFDAAILGGIGASPRPGQDRSEIAAALESPDRDTGKTPTANAFRAFAEASGNDLVALGAIMRAERPPVEDEALAKIENPVLIAVGEKDTLAGDPRELQRKIPGAELVVVPDRDHLTVVGDSHYQEAVVCFLAEQAR